MSALIHSSAMAEQMGFFKRLARWEYDSPVKANLIVFSAVIAMWLLLSEYWFALAMLLPLGVRIWGMRPGGYIRRAMQKRYGWE